jgi:hypothetical protein
VGERANENGPIRVLLADDHTMFREGIASVLSDYGGMEVVGQTDNDEGGRRAGPRARARRRPDAGADALPRGPGRTSWGCATPPTPRPRWS